MFSYFAGFESILYALVMGHLLLGVGRTISIIERVQLSWVHILIVTQILLTLCLGYYYSFFIQDLYVKTAETSKWLWFFTRILPVGVLYLLSVQLFPEYFANRVDYQDLIRSRARRILALFTVFMVTGLIRLVSEVCLSESGCVANFSAANMRLFIPQSISLMIALFALSRSQVYPWLAGMSVLGLLYVIVLMSMPVSV